MAVLRNRRIAHLFRALVRKDQPTLREQFPDVARYLRGHSTGRVGLLVERVEHGMTLAQMLPDRYADNVCYLAQNVPEGRQVLQRVRQLLRPLGMALKGDGGVLNLASKRTEAHLLALPSSGREMDWSLALARRLGTNSDST